MSKNITFDTATLNRIYKEVIKKCNLAQPWLVSLLKREQALDADENNMISIESMVGGMVDVLPSVKPGDAPIKIDTISFSREKIPLDYFRIETSIDANQFAKAHRTLNAIENGEITEKTAKDVILMLYGNDFARARIAYNNKIAFFFYRLICRGEFSVERDIHNTEYHYKVKDYITKSGITGTDFKAAPVDIMTDLIDEVTSRGGSVKSILLGSQAASAFINSEWSQKHMKMLQISGFNYSPIRAINPTNATIQAKGVWDITDLGDVKVRKVVQKIKVDGIVKDAFDPDAVIAVDENNIGTLFTKPTVRNMGNGNFQFDSSDMSYYKFEESDQHISHRSAGFYLPAITQPQNIMKLNIDFQA